jgi:hypothetical protein
MGILEAHEGIDWTGIKTLGSESESEPAEPNTNGEWPAELTTLDGEV